MSRFDRQIPIFGTEGQKKIRDAHVFVAGCGGLGSYVLMNLALAGVGKLTFVDYDVPSESNLNRQFVYFGESGSKSLSMAKYLQKFSDIEIISYDEKLTDSNCDMMLDSCDIAVDCLDSISSRKVLNRGIVRKGIPMVHGGVDSMFGQVTVIIPGITPCLECMFGKDIERTTPSVSTMVSLIASIQSNEVLKLITGKGEPLVGKMLSIDTECGSYRVIDISKRDGCPVCGH